MCAAALVLAGCAAEPVEEEAAVEEEAVETVEAAPELDFLACAVSDEASFQDNSFNEAVSTVFSG